MELPTLSPLSFLPDSMQIAQNGFFSSSLLSSCGCGCGCGEVVRRHTRTHIITDESLHI